ncbi:hypothetical protein JCM5296_003016 [Sporobolomyces johnsonii]
MPPLLRDPYSTPPDFCALARSVPAFAPFLRKTGKGATIDWQNDEAVRALTSALLERDFGLQLSLPEDRLCPTVPSRLEYVLWVLKLALLTSDSSSTLNAPSRLTGLDVGTGASAIYPLLACRTLCPPDRSSSFSSSSSSAPAIQMLATDIDAHSLSFAEKNVFENGLLGQISLFHVEKQGRIFPPEVVESVEIIDFTMCNPPFYASPDEIAASLAAKELEPFAVCTGASNEMLTPGGEVAFVSRMIDESLSLGSTKIRWFTSLLGKFSSISPLVDLLKSHHIANYLVHALPPHGQTTRWILTWSLQDRRIPSVRPPSPPPSLPPFLLLPSPPDPALARFAAPTQGLHTYIVPSSSSSSSSFSFSVVERGTMTQDGASVVDVDAEGEGEGAAANTDKDEDEVEEVRGVLEAVLEELGGPESGISWNWDDEEGDGAAAAAEMVGVGKLRWEEDEEEEEEEGREAQRKRRRKNPRRREVGGQTTTTVLHLAAWRNGWSRSARRAAAASRAVPKVEALSPSPGKREGDGGRRVPLLEARISISRIVVPSPPPGPAPSPSHPSAHVAAAVAGAAPAPRELQQIRLEAEWTRGLDRSSARQDFTGLWGFLIRKVAEGMKRRGPTLEEGAGERGGKVGKV